MNASTTGNTLIAYTERRVIIIHYYNNNVILCRYIKKKPYALLVNIYNGRINGERYNEKILSNKNNKTLFDF